jgi:hypothetical protein
MHSIRDYMDANEVLGFKELKGRFSRAQALQVKRELRRLAWR